MNDITIMESPKFGQVRKMEIGGETLYCATDVACALDYANPYDAIKRHCKSEGVVKHVGVSKTVNQYEKENEREYEE